MNIILIGFKSSGKTMIGNALADELGWTFADTDQLLEKKHKKLKGEKLAYRAIHKKYGRDYFRELEGQVVDGLPKLKKHVVASGGGTFINHALTDELRKNAMIIYLMVPPMVLWGRLQYGGMPAFFKGPNHQLEFSRYYHKRSPLYHNLADYIISADQTLSVTLAEIKECLEEE